MVKASVKYVHERVLDMEPHLLAAIEPIMMIPTHMSFEERMFIFQTAANLPQEFVGCEIGSYLGSSTALLACIASFNKGHVYAIDTFNSDAMTENGVDTFADFCRHVYHYRNIITVLRGHSSKMYKEVPDALDFLFIDGDHSCEQTLQDLKHYYPKLKPGGVLLMHDTNRESVQKAYNEFAPNVTELGGVHTMKAYKVNN